MAEARVGCYVYCVIEAEQRPPLEGARGVDPRFGVELLTHRRLSALISSVSLDEFGAEALKRNLEDMSWLERTARGHQAVLDLALSSQAVIPMRLCTVFTERARVQDMLARQHDSLLVALERLRDHSEWSLKVLAERGRVEAAAHERSQAAGAAAAGSAARAYLARKKAERTLREDADARLDAAVEEIHARLREPAAAATLLPPQNPEVSGRSGEMVLNAAYLLHRDRVVPFTMAVDELRQRHRDLGLTLELGGPWAPYNFVADAQPAS